MALFVEKVIKSIIQKGLLGLDYIAQYRCKTTQDWVMRKQI